MSQIIECPGCAKKYRLPETPPATLTCNNCGTLMDLSDFGGKDPAPAGPPRSRSSRAAAGRRGGAPSRGGGGGGAPRRAASSRSRRGAPVEEEAGYRGRGRGRSQGPNQAAIWGSVVGLVCVVVIAIVALGGDDEPQDPKKAGGTEVVDNGGAGDPGPSYDNPPSNNSNAGGGGDTASGNGNAGNGNAANGASGNAGTPAGNSAGNSAGGSAKPADEPKKPVEQDPGDPNLKKADVANGKMVRKPSYKRYQIKTFEWPEHLGNELKAQMENAIEGVYTGGRDHRVAEEFFQGVDRDALVMIVNEFKKLESDTDMHPHERMSLIMAFDTALRKVDGAMERHYNNKARIKHGSSDKYATQVIKAWSHWFETENYKIPLKPWDSAVDEIDDEEDRLDGKKKVDDKPKGFGD